MKKFLSSVLVFSAFAGVSVSAAKNTLTAPDHLVARLSRSTTTVFLPVLTWKDTSSGEDGFSVERKVGNATDTVFAYVGSVNRNVTTFTDTSANDVLIDSTSTADIPFIYRVSAFNQTSSVFSNKAVIVSTYLSRNPGATSSPDFPMFDTLRATVGSVGSMIKQQGENVINSFSPAAKVKASADSCTDLPKNLTKGSPAQTTMMLQKFLIAKGLLPGEASGVYGDFTVEAVKTYQRSVGLPETGKVYDFTRKAIKQETCN